MVRREVGRRGNSTHRNGIHIDLGKDDPSEFGLELAKHRSDDLTRSTPCGPVIHNDRLRAVDLSPISTVATLQVEDLPGRGTRRSIRWS